MIFARSEFRQPGRGQDPCTLALRASPRFVCRELAERKVIVIVIVIVIVEVSQKRTFSKRSTSTEQQRAAMWDDGDDNDGDSVDEVDEEDVQLEHPKK